MCFSTVIGLAVAGISAGVSAAGASARAEYDEEVAERNAKVNKIQAQQALIRGERDAVRVGREFSQLVGRQRATFASQGFDVSVGDPVRITEETLAVGREEQFLVQYNAQLDAWAATEAAVGAIQAGRTSRFNANIAMASGIVGGARAGLSAGLAVQRALPGRAPTGVGQLTPAPATGGPFAGGATGIA